MIDVRRTLGGLLHCMTVVMAVGITTSCAEVETRGPPPPAAPIVVSAERLAIAPLLPKLPVTAGVCYSPELRSGELEGWAGYDARVRFDLGAAAVGLIDQYIRALFERVVELPSCLPERDLQSGLDILLVPSIDKPPPEAFFWRYVVGVDVLSREGSVIAKVAARSENPTDLHMSLVGGGDNTLEAKARVKLREAATEVATALVRSDELDGWARSRGLRWEWPEDEALGPEVIAPSGVAIGLLEKGGSVFATAETVAVEDALRKLDPKITVVPIARLVDSVYPWLSGPGLDEAGLATWLGHPSIARRVGRVGLRYFAIAKTLRSEKTWEGAIGGMAMVGFLGFAWWERKEAAELQVFDLVAARQAGAVTHHRRVPLLAVPALIIPVPVPLPPLGGSMAEVVAKQLHPLVTAVP